MYRWGGGYTRWQNVILVCIGLVSHIYMTPKSNFIYFEALAVVTMKNSILGDAIPCSFIDIRTSVSEEPILKV
jgi:hypothetical protein